MGKSKWVISRGSYSDYRVLCIVDGKKSDAKMLAARMNATGDSWGDGYDIEEMPIVSPDVQRVEILNLTSEISDDGTTQERDPRISVEWPFDSLFGAPDLSWRWVRAPCHNGKGGRLEVWGTDHERVRKVFSDRRAMLLSDDALRAKREATGSR